MPSKRQKFVGGSLTFSSQVNQFAEGDGNDEADVGSAQTDAPAKAFTLTVDSAADLARVDFMGDSDPFVIGYLDGMLEPLFSTRVIEDDLNPIWDETFFIDVNRWFAAVKY
jgi:hypothetical protein